MVTRLRVAVSPFLAPSRRRELEGVSRAGGCVTRAFCLEEVVGLSAVDVEAGSCDEVGLG